MASKNGDEPKLSDVPKDNDTKLSDAANKSRDQVLALINDKQVQWVPSNGLYLAKLDEDPLKTAIKPLVEHVQRIAQQKYNLVRKIITAFVYRFLIFYRRV
jgi:hypothetical protein